MPTTRRLWGALAAAAICALAGGCALYMSWAIAAAPNRWNPLAGRAAMTPPERRLWGIDEQFWVDVGPPPARLLVSVVEPRGDQPATLGTVLLLHGVRASSVWMLDTARMLSAAGYRAVMVDLRGQGRSSGEWLTYGVQESQDLSQVIDELQRRGSAGNEIGAYGISYGATTAIHLAGRDRRVRAVVAVAPFDAMRDEVPHYYRTIAPGIGPLISPDTFQRAIDGAGRLGNFDPDAASAADAIRRTDAPVLIIHGTDDWMVPHFNSLALYDAARDHAELVLLDGLGHASIWLDHDGQVARRSRQWFERWLSGPACIKTRG